MALCCIGGVCVPYSAVVPLMIIGIKWILERMVRVGLIPSAWVDKLNAVLAGRLRGNTTTRAAAAVERAPSACCSSSASSLCDDSGSGGAAAAVRRVETEDDWNALAAGGVVVAKFTADWCHPCKAVHPAFCQLASKLIDSSSPGGSQKKAAVSFVTVDVDELDAVAAAHGIALLPTFAVFRSGRISAKYTGSDAARLEEFVRQELTKS
jgi:thiol-disulfide isomerase/thioredoxin